MTKKKLYGAIEAGGTKFVCAAGYDYETAIENQIIPTTGPDETFACARAFFEGVQQKHGYLAAFGVATFGPVDVDRASPGYGSVLSTPKPGWTGASFIEALASFGVPVSVDTDVNGAAIGEFFHGAGKRRRTLAYVTVGTGIGVGVVRDGKPLSGFGHYEMGHIYPPHDRARDPFEGRCPFHGDCLEGLGCGPAIIDRWGASLAELPGDHEAFELEAEYLAHLAQTIILTHMPDRIIFGGGVMKAPGLIEKLCEHTIRLLAGYVQGERLGGDLSDYIVAPGLGDLAGVTGAFELARQASEIRGEKGGES